MITGAQIRMALGALNWSRPDLAKRTGLSLRTVERICQMDGEPSMLAANMDAIRQALETGSARGRVQFVPGGAIFHPAE